MSKNDCFMCGHSAADKTKIIMDSMAHKLSEQASQDWVDEWKSMEDDAWDEECLEWLHSRPGNVQEAIVAFPPMCLVRAKESETLQIPAPGTVGILVSWIEKADGSITVRVIQSPDGNIAAECHQDWLEVADYCAGNTPEKIRSLLEQTQ